MLDTRLDCPGYESRRHGPVPYLIGPSALQREQGRPPRDEVVVARAAADLPGTQHGFNNDTTPRYDKAAADLAWKRTMELFQQNLRG